MPCRISTWRSQPDASKICHPWRRLRPGPHQRAWIQRWSVHREERAVLRNQGNETILAILWSTLPSTPDACRKIDARIPLCAGSTPVSAIWPVPLLARSVRFPGGMACAGCVGPGCADWRHIHIHAASDGGRFAPLARVGCLDHGMDARRAADVSVLPFEQPYPSRPFGQDCATAHR